MKIPNDLNRNVAPQTVSVYTRHGADCPRRGVTAEQKRAAKYEKRCDCPKWIYLFHDGKDYRLSANTRSWEKAERTKQHVEDELDPEKAELRRLTAEYKAKRVTIVDAVQAYLVDAESRNLSLASKTKRRRIFGKQLLSWAGKHNLNYLDEVTTSRLTEWRNTWHLAALTKQKTQELVRSFFSFCLRQDWLRKNPASGLTPIIVRDTPAEYFTREEFDKLVAATYVFGRGSRNPLAAHYGIRLRALLLLMRWTGLRIGDAVTLDRSRLVGNSILLYQAKTGTQVFVPLPAPVAELLRNTPDGDNPNPKYFFWTGKSRPSTTTGLWRKSFRRLFEIADLRAADGTPKRCHPHMFRHTFAIEMLLAGVPLDQVSMLLGHSSTRITERHYAKWVRARQEQLEKSVSMAHSLPEISKSAFGLPNSTNG